MKLNYGFKVSVLLELDSDMGTDDILLIDGEVPFTHLSFSKKTFLIANDSKDVFSEPVDSSSLKNIMPYAHLKYFKNLFLNHISFMSDLKKDISHSLFFQNQKRKIFILDKDRPKDLIIEDVKDFLSSHFQEFSSSLFLSKQSFINKVISCLDELLMNAIWDAHPGRSKLSRQGEVAIESKERVQIEILYKQDEVIFSVLDSWGAFDTNAIENLMVLALKENQNISINYDSRGANIGLSLVLKCFKNILIHANKKYGTRVSFLVTNDIRFKELSKLGYTILSYQD